MRTSKPKLDLQDWRQEASKDHNAADCGCVEAKVLCHGGIRERRQERHSTGKLLLPNLLKNAVIINPCSMLHPCITLWAQSCMLSVGAVME